MIRLFLSLTRQSSSESPPKRKIIQFVPPKMSYGFRKVGMGLPLIFLLIGLQFLTSCTETEAGQGQNPPASEDTTTHQNPNPPQRDDAVEMISSGPRNFGELLEMFTTDLVQDEYKKVKMDPLDQLPRFNEANESIFLRYQKIQPVVVDRGMKSYPRFILKSYRFASEGAADKAVTEWLNDFDSSADSIALGQSVDAVKSPPLYCSLRETGFFILQTACIYQHESQDSLKNRFFTWMEGNGARMGWEIGCDAGRLNYHFQNDL